LHEAKDKADAGCYEAQADNFGLEVINKFKHLFVQRMSSQMKQLYNRT